MLKDFYQNLSRDEKRNLLFEIVKQCEVREATAYNWIRGTTVPKILYQKIISKIVDADYEDLFPENRNKFTKKGEEI